VKKVLGILILVLFMSTVFMRIRQAKGKRGMNNEQESNTFGIVTLKINHHFDYIYVYIKITKVLHYTIR